MHSHPLLYWVRERENIRLARAAGLPGPWTDDLILRQFRFCNVRRRDDRVTQWIINNVIVPYTNHPNLWVMLALARYINLPATLQEIGEAGLWPTDDSPDWSAIGNLVDARARRGEQAWTGAYMIRAESNKNAPWYSLGKARYVTDIVIARELWENRDTITTAIGEGTVQAAHEAIAGRYGWGSFMAGQVVADLTYSPVLSNAPDLTTWAPLGPGSRRGLNRLAGRNTDDQLSQEDAVIEMREWYTDIVLDLGSEFSDISLHDVQNCLCEVDKYLRAETGEGRPRSGFTPHHE